MTQNKIKLTALQTPTPRHWAHQESLLAFLVETHNRSARSVGLEIPAERLLQRYGVKESQIQRRYFECHDPFLSSAERALYRVEEGRESGASIRERSTFFQARALEIFQELYPTGAKAPEHLIHITCTGYSAPSAAQVLVGERGWNTEVTHAYHMGCYGALPAIRTAWSLALGRGIAVDLVHTEMCSLHMNPAAHSPEQLVVQSLFADGHARYRIAEGGCGFALEALHERILPGTAGSMTWAPAPWGMEMGLSREVPEKIRASLRTFLQELLEKSSVSLEEALTRGQFAVHPGGPKVIDGVREVLELSEEQVFSGQRVLRERGNMSSATLPHLWAELERAALPGQTPVVSLAFGPGLTLFGSVFRWCP